MSKSPAAGRQMNAAAVAVCADSGSNDTTVKSEWGGFYGSVGGCQRVQEVHARIQSLCFSLCVFFCVRTEENDARVAARRPLATAAQTPIQQRSVASNLC